MIIKSEIIVILLENIEVLLIGWSCNINLKESKKLPVIFQNSRGYDSHLIFKELSKFNCNIDAIPNGLETYVFYFE